MKFYNCEEIKRKLYNSRLMNLFLLVLLIVVLMFNFKAAFSASLYAPDGTYLGEMISNPMAINSISNPLSQYGSPLSNTVNNPYSQYGSELSNQSPNNPYAVNPTAAPPPSLYEQ